MNLSQQNNSLSEIQIDAVHAAPASAATTSDQPESPAILPPAQQEVVILITELRKMSGSERHFDFNVRPPVNMSNRSAPADKEDLFERMRRLFFEIPPASNGIAHRSSATAPNDKL